MNSMNFAIGRPRLRYLIAIVLAAIYLLGYFFPAELWFTSSVTESPLTVQIAFWAVFCFLLFEEFLAIIDKLLGRLGEFLFNTLKNPLRAISVIIFGAVLIYLFRARHFIWGDSHVIVRYIEEFSSRGSNIARRYFVELFYWIFTKIFHPFGLSVFSVLMIVHSLLGGIFLWISLEFAKFTGKNAREKTAIFLVIATSSLFLIFTHIELYAPGLVCAMWFITLLVKNLEKKGYARYLFFVPLIFAVLFNPLYLYLTIIIPLAFIHKIDKRLIALLVMALIIGTLYFAGSGLSEEVARSYLPLSFPGYFVSIDHLWLKLNFLLFTTPAVLILLTKFEKKPNMRVQYMSALAITSTILIIPLFFELGALDWELASAMLFPVVIFAGYRASGMKPHLRAFIVALALILFCTEVYLNADNIEGESRAENVLLRQRTPYYLYNRSPLDRLVMTNIYLPEEFWDSYKVHRWGNKLIEYEPQYARPYLYLMSFNLWVDEPDRAAYYAFESIHSGKVGKDMVPRLMRFFAEALVHKVPTLEEFEKLYSEGGPFSLEPELIEELQQLAYTEKMPVPDREKSLEEVLKICLYMNQMAVAGHFEVVDAVYVAGKKLYPTSGNIELIYGAILLMDKRPTEANNALGRSFVLGGDQGSIFSNMGLVCAMLGDTDKGLMAVGKAIVERPWLASYRCNYSLLLSSKFGPDSAISYLDNYHDMAMRNGFPAEASMVREFMGSFIKE